MVAARAALSLVVATAVLAWVTADAETRRPPGDERPPHERLDLPSLVACGGCHLEEWKEWSTSLHGRAWTNANVRAATRDFRKASCRPCHSPRPVFETGLDRAPAYRDFNQEDGVHCLSCHGLADGVAAARTLPDAPCRPRFEPRLLQAESCFPCHEPTHGAFGEYRESLASDLGVRCVDCHMPARPDGGRSHAGHGGFDGEFVRRAVDFDVTHGEGELVVRVRNRCGHRFPGEIPARAFLLRVELPEAEPATVLLRKPHKREDRPDDRLRPDEERTFRFPLTRPGTARVRLLFQSLPLLPPGECLPLGSWEGPVPGAD